METRPDWFDLSGRIEKGKRGVEGGEEGFVASLLVVAGEGREVSEWSDEISRVSFPSLSSACHFVART